MRRRRRARSGEATVLGRNTLELLQAWRDADRRWEALDPVGPAARDAARDVLDAWLAYQDAVREDPREFVLVTDATGTYVAASANVREALGYPPEELIGRSVADLTPAAGVAEEARLWEAFVRDGRQEGRYEIRRRDGSILGVTYRARAHHPIPGYYTSRLRPLDSDKVR